MIEVLPLFPSLVFKLDTNPEFKSIRSDLLSFCYSEMGKDPDGINRSNYNSWHSCLYTSEKRFEKYKIFIEDNIKKIFDAHLLSQCNFKLDAAWININGVNSSNSDHDHPGSDLSGCIWVQSTPHSGSIRLKNPNLFSNFKAISSCKLNTKVQYAFSEHYFFHPIEGHMILFPSNISHCVFENSDCGDRISIAFNLSFL